MPQPPADAAGHELLLLLERVAALGDQCGRWCAENCAKLGEWGAAHSAQKAELEAQGERLVAVVRYAPAAAQQHLVAVTVRLAQVAKAFEAGAMGQGAAATVANSMNAWQQLLCLHGREGEGGAKLGATAECERLGDEMNEAWFRFPEAEREALRALPWENDPEPSEVDEWEEDKGAFGQEGESILRPHLRQNAPPAYIADDFDATNAATGGGADGDCDGAKYVVAHLLPAARRALPLLEAAARRVAQAMGADPEQVVRTPPLKTALRMNEKAGVGDAWGAGEADHFLHEYPRQASNVDVARVMLVVAAPVHVRQALVLFRALHEVSRVKNRFSPEAPLYGYRDMLLNLKIDGVYCEVQIGLAPLVAVRRKMHKYYGIVRSIGSEPLISMAKALTTGQVGEAAAAAAAAARAPVQAKAAMWELRRLEQAALLPEVFPEAAQLLAEAQAGKTAAAQLADSRLAAQPSIEAASMAAAAAVAGARAGSALFADGVGPRTQM
jgi:hypothetical protein